ncbi:MAG: Undecaprenyl-phosphate alpha-N-acetylglucosaminyl 1-phosphate transferase [Myxococcota bacterium]|nr:Undecaprenyl-phosphate alpha-N-acetylglucosaminyl 1-phosphate transferase [Myxococcota bacterium]
MPLAQLLTWTWAVYALSLILAFLITYYTTPIFRSAAIKFGIVDRPSTPLKTQREPVPYLGGLAIYAGVLTTAAVTYELNQEVLGIFLSGTMILLLGLVDDFGVLTPKVKLAGQIIATAFMVRSGVFIKLEMLPQWAAIALTFLWVVGLTNAINLIDIMDGLSSSVAAAASLALFSFALYCNRQMVAVLALAVAGAALGFFMHNKQPARIYMGDTGSLFLGFMLAALAMNNSYTRNNVAAAIAPALVLAVPIFDTTLVSVIRFLKGKPIMHGSPDHYALRLKKLGLTPPQVGLVSVLATLITSAMAWWMVITPSLMAAWLIGGGTLAALLAVGVLIARVEMPGPPPAKTQDHNLADVERREQALGKSTAAAGQESASPPAAEESAASHTPHAPGQ